MYRMANPYNQKQRQEPSWDGGKNPWETADQRPNWGRPQPQSRHSRPLGAFRRPAPQPQPQRKQQKERKKEGKDDFPQAPETLYKQIGSSEAYKDCSTEASYDWTTRLYPPQLSATDTHKKNGPLPLKQLAAMAVARSAQSLTVGHLQSVQWNTMRLVWECICAWRLDNFRVFQLFATVFYKEKEFQCHQSLSTTQMPKKEVILKNTLPNSTNHRVERLFANIRVSQFVNTLNSISFNNLVILEMSKPVQYDDLIYLTNLSNLTALRISRVADLPDPVIARWCTAIKTNKWTMLQMLSIPTISQEQFIKLQEIAPICKLMYLEVQSKTIFNMEREWQKLDYDNWTLLNDQSLSKLPWGLKSQAFMRKYKIQGHSVTPQDNNIWLDFNVLNHVYLNHYRDLESEFDHIWQMGEIMSYNQALVLKKKITPKQQPQLSRQPVLMKKPVLKKRKVIRDAKSFFDL